MFTLSDIQAVVSTLSDRQDKLEKSSAMLDLLSTQISGILLSVSTTQDHPRSSQENLSNTALTKVSCNLCQTAFESHTAIESHIGARHHTLLCDMCGKTLRIRPDFNFHHHKYHSETEIPKHPCLETARNSDSLCCRCGFSSKNEEDLSIHKTACHITKMPLHRCIAISVANPSTVNLHKYHRSVPSVEDNAGTHGPYQYPHPTD